MKYFIFLSLLCIVILASQKIYTEKSAQESLKNYLYAYLGQAPTSITAACNTKKKAIIFDLDGVLCTTNSLQAFYEIGITTILHYILLYGKPSTKKLFQALENAPALSTADAYNDGLRMPQIMIDWQTNAQELQDIQNAMIQHISDVPLSIIEKNLHISTVYMMTTPSKYIATKKIIQEAVQLIKILKKQGYKLYILSNWDAQSFKLFQEKFSEIFIDGNQEIFDGIMISGTIHMIKPNKDIFQACLKNFNIKASDAIFIDDTIENIQSAENCGIKSIHCKNFDMTTVKKELIAILKN